MTTLLLHLTDAGLYCPPGDFHIDPWRPVERAVITHAHADHARPGSRHYLATREGRHVLQARMGEEAVITAIEYGEAIDHHGVRVSLHPAGHVLGSAQVRIEHRGQVVVVSGDYKTEADPTCSPFEPVLCHTYVTESTFGLPIYRWAPSAEVFRDINAWWKANHNEGRASLIFAYSLGKAQRLLAGVDATIGPIFTHGAVERMTRAYRDSGVSLPPTTPVGETVKGTEWAGALIVAPPSAHGSAWARKFGPTSTAFASGWMRIRGPRRRKAVDRGFALSDHADWPGLLSAITATGAEEVWVTHGYVAVLVRHLIEKGVKAVAVATQFEGEREEVGGEE